jgi:hypothetical protein
MDLSLAQSSVDKQNTLSCIMELLGYCSYHEHGFDALFKDIAHFVVGFILEKGSVAIANKFLTDFQTYFCKLCEQNKGYSSVVLPFKNSHKPENIFYELSTGLSLLPVSFLSDDHKIKLRITKFHFDFVNGMTESIKGRAWDKDNLFLVCSVLEILEKLIKNNWIRNNHHKKIVDAFSNFFEKYCQMIPLNENTCDRLFKLVKAAIALDCFNDNSESLLKINSFLLDMPLNHSELIKTRITIKLSTIHQLIKDKTFWNKFDFELNAAIILSPFKRVLHTLIFEIGPSSSYFDAHANMMKQMIAGFRQLEYSKYFANVLAAGTVYYMHADKYALSSSLITEGLSEILETFSKDSSYKEILYLLEVYIFWTKAPKFQISKEGVEGFNKFIEICQCKLHQKESPKQMVLKVNIFLTEVLRIGEKANVSTALAQEVVKMNLKWHLLMLDTFNKKHPIEGFILNYKMLIQQKISLNFVPLIFGYFRRYVDSLLSQLKFQKDSTLWQTALVNAFKAIIQPIQGLNSFQSSLHGSTMIESLKKIYASVDASYKHRLMQLINDNQIQQTISKDKIKELLDLVGAAQEPCIH